ncbi:MAG TPA: AI-2E family transporter [Acidimicrobiales bacterium]
MADEPPAPEPPLADGPSSADDSGWLGPSDAMPAWVPRAMVWFFGGVVALFVGSWLLGRLRDLLITLLVALFISFALEPAVNMLAARGWRRGTATALVFTTFVVLSLVFVGAVGKVVFDETNNLIDNAPGYIEDGEDWLNRTFDLNLSSDQLSDQLSDPEGPFRSFVTSAAGNALGLSFSVVGVVFRLFTIALFVFYLVADGPRFRRVVCSFLRPRRQRVVLDTWEIAIQKTGGYIYSRGLLAVLSGLFHWVAFTVIGIKYAIALAVFVGLVSQFIPVVGTYIAAGLPILIALASSPADALWVAGFAIAYQQIENYLFAPRITARTMSLHPAVAFGTVIAGAGLLGGIGALLALPAAAVIQAVGSTYIERHPVVDTPMTVVPQARPGLLTRTRLAWRRRTGTGDS